MNLEIPITIYINSHSSQLPKDYIPIMPMSTGVATLVTIEKTQKHTLAQWVVELPMADHYAKDAMATVRYACEVVDG